MTGRDLHEHGKLMGGAEGDRNILLEGHGLCDKKCRTQCLAWAHQVQGPLLGNRDSRVRRAQDRFQHPQAGSDVNEGNSNRPDLDARYRTTVERGDVFATFCG